MSRISTVLSIATHRVGVASAYPHISTAPSAALAHAAAGPVLILVLLGIGCVMVVARVNSVLVDLVSHLVQIAAAVGRMLVVILVLIVLGSIVLLHI